MPLHTVQNKGAIFSAVAVDPIRDEIIMADEGKERIMVYDRLSDTPPRAAMTEPKRILGGPKTLIRDNCSLYVDPVTGDIYSPSADTSHNMSIFSRDAQGNVRPDRVLKTPHRPFGIAADEQSQELFIATQWPAAVFVYRKAAADREAPLRIIEGKNTQLSGSMGLALDTKNQELYVSNWGSTSDVLPGMSYSDLPVYGEGVHRAWENADQLQQFFRRRMIPGSGRITPPAITVFDLKAKGNIAPKRVITGPSTKLDWAQHLSMDMDRRELYVANSMDNSLLVFKATDSGDVAPIRMIKGPKTEINTPLGVYFDAKNQEVILSNWGNQRAVVFKPGMTGDVAPIRRIRTVPDGTGSPMLSHLGGMSYDTKRDEILAFQ
jgi:6-phosphogluconolactonase (cycloisomerase 2 family)